MRLNLSLKTYRETEGRRRLVAQALIHPFVAGVDAPEYKQKSAATILTASGITKKYTARTGKESESCADQLNREKHRLFASMKYNDNTCIQLIRQIVDIDPDAFLKMLAATDTLQGHSFTELIHDTPNGVVLSVATEYQQDPSPSLQLPIVNFADVLAKFQRRGMISIAQTLGIASGTGMTEHIENKVVARHDSKLMKARAVAIATARNQAVIAEVKQSFYLKDDSVGMF
jgi:hypothetical protein